MTRTRRTSQGLLGLLVLAAAVLATARPVRAGGVVFFPGQMKDGVFLPDKETKGPVAIVRYCDVAVAIDGGTARTTITQSIGGPDKRVPVVALVPLPAGVAAGSVDLSWSEPRAGAAPRTGGNEGRLLSVDEAQKVYEAIARGTDSTAVLGLSGRPAYLFSLELAGGTTDFTLKFEQPITEADGVRWYECPLPLARFARGPAARLSVSAALKGTQPLRSILSPSHDLTVSRQDLFNATASLKAEQYAGNDDLRLAFVADADDLGLRLLAFREPGEGDGYFLLLGNPTGSATPAAATDKDVVFVLDTSGSMRGEKIEQARAAIDYCLEHLGPGDRFNIITFGTEVSTFRADLVKADKAGREAGRQFIETVVAQGRTNISEALVQGVAGKAEAGRPRIMIFLTDGTPTAGQVNAADITAALEKANTSATRVFVVGVGHDVNAQLLDKVAEMTDGASEYVAPTEEIDVKVAGLYDRLSEPVLTGVKLAFGGLRTHSVYPRKLPALFKGGPVLVFGQYKEGGRHTVTVSGLLAGREKSYSVTADFPDKAGAPRHAFIAPLWAARKIGFLLQEIRLHGRSQELIGEVVALSRKFGIVTEYTEFLADGRREMDLKQAVALAQARVAKGAEAVGGQWAVNQSVNSSALKGRMVAGNVGNSYLDRSGRLVNNTLIQQQGGRTFYFREGQWVDAEDAGARKTRTVKLYSPEYLELVRNHPDFARAQALGWATSMNIGDERIVVEKDGKTRDEALEKELVKPPPVIDQAPNGMNQRQLQQRNLDLDQRANIIQAPPPAPREQPKGEEPKKN